MRLLSNLAADIWAHAGPPPLGATAVRCPLGCKHDVPVPRPSVAVQAGTGGHERLQRQKGAVEAEPTYITADALEPGGGADGDGQYAAYVALTTHLVSEHLLELQVMLSRVYVCVCVCC